MIAWYNYNHYRLRNQLLPLSSKRRVFECDTGRHVRLYRTGKSSIGRIANCHDRAPCSVAYQSAILRVEDEREEGDNDFMVILFSSLILTHI